MPVLISDTNIIIDLEEGHILKELFSLPFSFAVPDILYFEELENSHEYLLDYGLLLQELSIHSLKEVTTIIEKYPKPSRNDCFALMLAKQEQCPLLTGDEDLRSAAREEGVACMGTLWVVEHMVQYDIITKKTAFNAYQEMKNRKRRLPWNDAFNRLEALATQ
jgi:predicted nucleic acid-binding protein